MPHVYRADSSPLRAGTNAPTGSYEDELVSILSNYFDVDYETDTTSLYRFDDDGGGRDVIGPTIELLAEWVAIRQNPAKAARTAFLRQKIIDLALDAAQRIDFAQDESLFVDAAGGIYYGGHRVGKHYHHKPYAFYPAALLTTVPTERAILFQAMIHSHDLARRASSLAPYSTNYYIQHQERSYGWYFRDFGSLCHAEELGLLPGNHYRTEEAEMLAHVQAQMNHPFIKNMHILGSEVWKIMDGTNGSPLWDNSPWQMAYVIMGVCHMVRCGRTAWLPVLEWQIQYYFKVEQKWGWIGLDAYQHDWTPAYDAWVAQGEPAEFDPFDYMTMSSIHYDKDGNNAKALAIANADPAPATDRLVSVAIDGQNITAKSYINEHLFGVRDMAALAVTGAAGLAQTLVNLRQERIDRGDGLDGGPTVYRFSNQWRALTPQPL